ncbi:HtaA domain-containing protein, partial [Corynebacterium otitidis]|uniref:HtaA domain-containing protein n=1 Tax=Corynebacterium otitidis TaxID=29321 RepID=UPI000B0E0411
APEVASGSAPRPAAALRPLPAAGPQRASELKTDDDSSDGGGGDEEVALSENVCEDENAQGVEESQAHWGVKQSFQSYITGSIAQGQWQLADVEHYDGEYHFDGANGAVSPDGEIGTLAYEGALHFTGHGGILDLLIEDPEIQWEGEEGHLIAVVVSNTIEGEPIDYGRTSVGRLEFEELDAGSGKASGRARLYLSESGSQAFAEFYEPGLELDPVSFEAELGGTPNCTDVQGTATSGGAQGEIGGSAADKAAELRRDFDPDQTTGAENDGDQEFTVHDAKPAGVAGFADPNTPLVVTAAFLIAGGAMTAFVLRHPNS